MNSIKEFVLNEYENLEFEKILVETFLYFINEEYVDDISVTDLLEVIEESNVNLKEEPIVQLMYESVKDKPTQTEKKAEALTAKKEVIKDKIENLQASKEKIEPKDKIAKAEVNVEILQNKEKGAEIAVAKDKLLDKDSSNNEEKAKEYKEATGIATDLVKIKKEKIESEDDPEKKAVLKSLETQKSLELKAVTTELTPEDKERLKKSQEDVEKKLKEIEDKKSEEESKEDTDSEEENDDDVKDDESKDDESKEDEEDDKNSKEIEKLTVEIESLKDQIDSSKKQEDDILEALKEKTDALADSERLQRLVMKKRLDNKIEFTEMLLDMIQNKEQKALLSKKTDELKTDSTKLEKVVDDMEDEMEDKSKKDATPEEVEKIEAAKAEVVDTSKSNEPIQSTTVGPDKKEELQIKIDKLKENIDVIKAAIEKEKELGNDVSAQEKNLEDSENALKELEDEKSKLGESTKDMELNLWAISVAIDSIKKQLVNNHFKTND